MFEGAEPDLVQPQRSTLNEHRWTVAKVLADPGSPGYPRDIPKGPELTNNMSDHTAGEFVVTRGISAVLRVELGWERANGGGLSSAERPMGGV